MYNDLHYKVSNNILDNFSFFKKKLKIAIIHSGDCNQPNSVLFKTHNPRSWKSYKQVAEDIQNALFEIGFENVFICKDDISLLNNLYINNINFAWLNTGGVQGYASTCHASAMLEMAGIPYIGHNPVNSILLDYKHLFKHLLTQYKIKTSPFLVVHNSYFRESVYIDKDKISFKFGDYKGPFVIKPSSSRASLNIQVVNTIDEINESIKLLFKKTNNYIVIEKYLPGREFCAAITGPVIYKKGKIFNLNKPFVFSVIERILDQNEIIFTSMDKKPITNDRLRIFKPDKEKDLYDKIVKIAESIFQNFYLRALVRVDLRTDENGEIHVLEVNPKPDLKKPLNNITSLVCMGLNYHNMDYNDLIASILIDRICYLIMSRKHTISHILDFSDIKKYINEELINCII